jgi:hypothetical protein
MRLITKTASAVVPACLILALAAACGSSGNGTSTGDSGVPTDDAHRKADTGADTGAHPADGAADAAHTDAEADGALDSAPRSDGESSVDAGMDVAKIAPQVVSVTPANAATAIAINSHLSATFSEAMDPASLSTSTFTVTSGSAAVEVAGTVVYANSKALFWPAANLASNTTFTATISTGATSASGLPLGTSYVWMFSTAANLAAGVPVDLGTASQYVVLAKTAISTVSPSVITGNLGISPAAATYITGFSLMADPTNVFSTSSQVTGKVYAADYATPTPANLTTAIGDMTTAFTAAAGRAPDVTDLGAGSIGGMTLPAGVYGWDTGLLLATDVTLNGSATDVWVFQVAKNLTVSNGAHLVLAGGALPENVFWQVSGDVSLGTTVKFAGTILCQTGITLGTGASITGGMLAQTAVTLHASAVVAAP